MFVSTAPPPHILILIGTDKQMPKNVWLRLPLSEKSFHTRDEEGCAKWNVSAQKKKKKHSQGYLCGRESCPHFICGRFFKWLRRCCVPHLDTKQWLSYTSRRALSLFASRRPTLTKPLSRKVPFFHRHVKPTCCCFFQSPLRAKQCRACVCEQEHVPPSDLESSWQHHQTFMRETERPWRTVQAQGYRERERGRERGRNRECEHTKVNGTYLH